ncbi:hypothetical protein, partial [Bacillus haynesii]|uniref:hypothetical protein n=1 Tax=Bacillus haynesii TaxID=1925021 RepID=UPI00195B2AF7
SKKQHGTSIVYAVLFFACRDKIYFFLQAFLFHKISCPFFNLHKNTPKHLKTKNLKRNEFSKVARILDKCTLVQRSWKV